MAGTSIHLLFHNASSAKLFVFYRCKDTNKQESENKEDKCLFLENSGSEDDVLQILQYMATILGNYAK